MAMLQCDIVTPEKLLFSGEASMVEAPSVDGSFGILPGHEAFSCLVSGGIVKVSADAEHEHFQEYVVTHGFAQVYDDKVTILVRAGALATEIDVAEVSARLASLKQRYDAMSDEDKAAAKSYSEIMQGGDANALPDTSEGLAARATANAVLDDIEWCELQLSAAGK